MANNSYEQPIDKHVNWAGDASTEGKAVSGEYVQKFIKDSLEDRIGCIKYFKVLDGTAYKNMYYCFADEENYEKFSLWFNDPTNIQYTDYRTLKIAEFEAPAPYTISISLDTENSIKSGVPILYGSTGNNIVYSYTVKDSSGSDVSDGKSATVIYTVKRGGVELGVVTQTYYDHTSCSYSIDKYLTQAGSYSVTIKLSNDATGISTTAEIQFNVVQLAISDSAFEYYKPVSGIGTNKFLEFRCNAIGISGYNNEIEIFIDGEKRPELTIGGDADDTHISVSAMTSINKNLDISYLWNQGTFKTKHNIQARVCSSLSVTKYYSSTLYFDFAICPTGTDETSASLYELLLKCDIETTDSKSGVLIDTAHDEIELNYTQFSEKSIYYALCDTSSIGSTIKWEIGEDSASDTLTQVPHYEEHAFTYQPMIAGVKNLFITASKNTTNVKPSIHVKLNVAKNTSLNIDEFGTTSGNLELKLTGKNKSNDSANPGTWTYQNLYKTGSPVYSTTFNNVNFNSVAGWHDNALVLTQGATIDINISPFNLLGVSGGKITNGITFEIEFEVYDIKGGNDTSINIMNYGDGQHASNIIINSDSAYITSDSKTQIKTNYKDSEKIKLAFIINPTTSATDPNLIYIVNNGVLERAAAYSDNDGFTYTVNTEHPKKITIGNPDGQCTVKIYNIRIYTTAISVNNELSNYLYDYDVKKLYDKVLENDILDSDEEVSYDFVKGKIPVMIFKGNYSQMRLFKSKDNSELFNITYTNPQNPRYNFNAKRVHTRKQGTSSLKYPVPNFRLYLEKDNSTEFQYIGTGDDTWYTKAWQAHPHPQTGEAVDGKLEYSLKDGSIPTKWFTIKADYAESSMTHNTGMARWLNDLYKATTMKINGKDTYILRTDAQTAAATYANQFGYTDVDGEYHTYDIRTCVDGIPMCVFVQDTYDAESGTDRGLDYDGTDLKTQYIGTYIFNTDKKSNKNFGFKDLEISVKDEEMTSALATAYNTQYADDIAKGEKTAAQVGVGINKWKIFNNKKCVCWEGSNNGSNILKGRAIDFDVNVNVSSSTQPLKNYDASAVDKRNIFGGIETRYPDEDDYTRGLLTIPGNLFNNSASFESMIRFLNFCEPAVSIKIGKKDVAFNPNDPSTYYDGYNYTKWTQATLADITAGKNGTKTLYKKTSLSEEGKEDEYTEVAPDNIVTNDIYYLINDNIDYDKVVKTDSNKQIGKQLYFGTVKNWQYYAIQKLLEPGSKYDPSGSNIELTDEDRTYIGDFFEDNVNGFGNPKALSHDVRVIVESGAAGYTYIDGFGKTAKYEGELEIIEGYNRTDTYMKFFNDHFSDYFKEYNVAAYYSFIRRFNAVDQVVKNTMWTTEDNKHFYCIHYDNDTIIGVRNDAQLIFDWKCDRSTYDYTLNNWAYAGFDAILWNNIECSSSLMSIVKQVDNALTKASGDYLKMTYNNACHWLDDVMSNSWSERMYNYSEKFKYTDAFTSDAKKDTSSILTFLQGNRKSHRHWWLRHRFDLVDAEWMSGEYSDFYLSWYAAGMTLNDEMVRITPATDFYFGYQINDENGVSGAQTGIYIKAGQEYTFKCGVSKTLNVGDPIYLMGPYEIDTLDFSHAAKLSSTMAFNGYQSKSGSYIETRGTKLRRLIVGSEHPTNGTGGKIVFDAFGDLNKLTLLEELDITNIYFNNTGSANGVVINALPNLRVFKADGSNISEFNPSEDAKFDTVILPNTITTINLNNVTFNSSSSISYTPNKNLMTLTIKNCKFANNNDSFNIVRDWVKAIKRDNYQNIKSYKLTLSGINWSNLSNDVDFVDTILSLLELDANVSGTVNFGALSFTDYSRLIKPRKKDGDPDDGVYGYGSDCFNDNGNLKFEARSNHYVFSEKDGDILDYQTPRSINAGKSIKFGGQLFPLSLSRDYHFRLFSYNSRSGEYTLITSTSDNRCQDYQSNDIWYTSYIIDPNASVLESTGKKPCVTLNNWTGELISDECENGCELYIGMSLMSNRNTRITEAYPIKLTVNGVTLPQNVKLMDGNTQILVSNGTPNGTIGEPIVFDDADDKVFNINYSSDDSYEKSSTDADIKAITATYTTYKHGGEVDTYHQYIEASKVVDEDKLTVKLIDIPSDVTGANYDTVKVKIKIEFDSTLTNRYLEFELEVHVMNITPTYFTLHRFEYLTNDGLVPFNGEWSDLTQVSENTYTYTTDGQTYQVVDCMTYAGDTDGGLDIIDNGYALHNYGKYKVFIKYYTSFGKHTSSTKITTIKGSVDDNVQGASGVLYLLDVYNDDDGTKQTYTHVAQNANSLYIDTTVSKDWFYVAFDAGNMTYARDLQASLTVAPRTGSTGSEVELTRLNSDGANKFWMPINYIAPNDVLIEGGEYNSNNITYETYVAYRSEKTVTLNYQLTVPEGNAIGEHTITSDDINSKYEIVLSSLSKQSDSYDISNTNLLNQVNVTSNGFTIKIDKISDDADVPGREHPLIYKCTVQLKKKSYVPNERDIVVSTNTITIKAYYSFSSASSIDELKDVNENNIGTDTNPVYYLLDNNNEYWEVDNLDEMKSTNWDTYGSPDDSKRLVGLGFKTTPVGQSNYLYVFMCIDSQYAELLYSSSLLDGTQRYFPSDPAIYTLLSTIAPECIPSNGVHGFSNAADSGENAFIDSVVTYETESNLHNLYKKNVKLHDYLVENGLSEYNNGGIHEYYAYKFGEMYSNNSKFGCYMPSAIQMAKLLLHKDDINSLLDNYGPVYLNSKLDIDNLGNEHIYYRTSTLTPPRDGYPWATVMIKMVGSDSVTGGPASTSNGYYSIPFIYAS